MKGIRIGQVSSINYAKGMIKVLYEDKDSMVTAELPMLTFNDEYKMPSIGDYALVAHLSNGSEAGVVLGTYWNGAKGAVRTGKEVYRKEFAHTSEEAYIDYDEKEKEFILKADKISIFAKELNIAVEDSANIEAEIINLKADTIEIEADKMIIDAPIEMQGNIVSGGDVIAGGVSLQGHTHGSPAGETDPPS